MLFDDMINIRNFGSSLLKTDKTSYKNIDIYYIGYITKKDSEYVNIHSVNLLYLIINKVDGFIEEREGSKYLNLEFTDNKKEVLKKYAELWNRIKNLIEKIDHKPGKNGKDYMKIKFNSDDNLPLDKPLKFQMLTKIVRYYPQIYLDECLYEL